MKKIDYHCHFSGSLSPLFLSQKTTNLSSLLPKFSSNWHKNFDLFFNTYAKIQAVTKSANPSKQTDLYISGSYDICSSYISDNVDEFHLRIGPRIDIKETCRRLTNTIKGFEEAEKQYQKQNVGKLILTLIHDRTSYFFNTNSQSLKILLTYLEDNPHVSERVIGFDFSGPEKNFEQKKLFNLLSIIADYNKSKKQKKYEIAVHAGEYVDEANISNQYDYLDSLIKRGVDRLSHGTIIWLDPNLINRKFPEVIFNRQQILIDQLAKQGVHIEICPTANKLLSPLRTQKDIPLSVFEKKGIRYSINTDNKTIFDTSLKKEWNYFPSNITNPFKATVKGSKIVSLFPKSSLNLF